MIQQRNTPQRQLVLETVLSHHDHPTADQIYLDVRAVNQTISRGTVYRNLSQLAENGDILQVKAANADRFDRRLDLHHHIICLSCGEVCDACVPYNRELEQQAMQTSKYIITQHRTVFEGLCPKCQAVQKL